MKTLDTANQISDDYYHVPRQCAKSDRLLVSIAQGEAAGRRHAGGSRDGVDNVCDARHVELVGDVSTPDLGAPMATLGFHTRAEIDNSIGGDPEQRLVAERREAVAAIAARSADIAPQSFRDRKVVLSVAGQLPGRGVGELLALDVDDVVERVVGQEALVDTGLDVGRPAGEGEASDRLPDDIELAAFHAGL